MSVFLTPNAKQQFFTDGVALASGYKLYTYAHGTSYATPLATYADKDGNTANPNPVVLDSRGEAVLYLESSKSYDYVLKDADGTTIWTRDGISGGVSGSDLAAATTGKGAGLVGFLQAGTDAVARTAEDKLRELGLSVLDFYLDTDTDYTSALEKAVAAAEDAGIRYVQVPADDDLEVSETIVLTSCVLVGHGGHTSQTVINGSHTSGPVIQIKGRSCGVHGIRIGSTADRYAASTTTGHGLFIAGDDVATDYPSLSRQDLHDVYITEQPTDGFHAIGPLEHSHIRTITAQDCKRHGFVSDGGTIAGYTNTQTPPFELDLWRCRAYECGGQGFIIISSETVTVTDCTLHQCEALGCCWDVDARYLDAPEQMYLSGTNIRLDRPDVEDQQYANSTTVLGNTKTSRSTPSSGILRFGNGTVLDAPFFSSLVQSYNQTSGDNVMINAPRINTGAYATNQSPAIKLASSVTGARVYYSTASTAGAAVVLQNQSVGSDVVADGVRLLGTALTASDWIVSPLTTPTATIASGVLTATSSRTVVAGEGAASDTLTDVQISASVDGYKGLDLYLIRGSQDIVVKHGTGNIKLAGAADLTMSSTANTVLHFLFDGTNWVQA